MNQPTDTPPPPEAVLIRRAAKAIGMSPEKAAPLTGVIKPSQWRNIESGKTSAKDDVLAHMAYVVRLQPEDLEQVGRTEAAEILRLIKRDRERDPEVKGEDESGVEWRDRQYRRWREDRDKGQALDQIFRTWDDRSA